MRNAKLAATFLVAGSLIGADLTRASMFATQLSFANLAGANLTGVCISNLGMEGWDINEVICQYFYTAEVGKIESYGRRNIKKTRVPKKGYLLEGEFEDRFKSRPTIEFIFENGMPSFGPAILDLAIVQANLKMPEAGLRLLDITARGGLPRAVIETTEQISKREALALVEACYQQKIKQMAGEIKELKQDKRSLLQVISQKVLLPAMESVEDEWIRITDAARIVGVAKGMISRWADKGKICDNGKKKKERRVSKLSVLSLKHKREHEEVLMDAAEDLQDRASKIPDRH